MKLFSLILVFSSLESGSLNFKEFQMEYFKIFPSMPFSQYNSFSERHFWGKTPTILKVTIGFKDKQTLHYLITHDNISYLCSFLSLKST